jgi:hypothetical protein
VYTAVHEDFEGASNAVMASAIVLHQPANIVTLNKASYDAGCCSGREYSGTTMLMDPEIT